MTQRNMSLEFNVKQSSAFYYVYQVTHFMRHSLPKAYSSSVQRHLVCCTARNDAVQIFINFAYFCSSDISVVPMWAMQY